MSDSKSISPDQLTYHNGFYDYTPPSSGNPRVGSVIPTGSDVPENVDWPCVTDGSSNYYELGVEMEYQSSWGSGVTVEIEVPAGWEIEGWTLVSSSPRVYSKLITSGDMQAVASGQNPYLDVPFTFAGEGARKFIQHDPKVRITPPPSR